LPDAQPVRLFRYHKPSGLLTTHRDPQGRPTVFERLPPHLPRVVSVGRLDLDSEGLLLLTTSGELARKLEMPARGWKRRYRVRALGRPELGALAKLAKGVTVAGMKYGPVEAKLDRQQGANAWLTMSLTDGKNREVRKLCEHLGLTVNRLIRIAYGPFQLGNLPKGEVDEVPRKVVKEQVGA
jgi:23S rRNA pseudouridine2605 synthase